MAIAFRCIEEKIENFRTGNMHVLGSNIGEDDPRGGLFASPSNCRLLEVLLTDIWEAKQPKDRIRDAGEDTQPSTESSGFNL